MEAYYTQNIDTVYIVVLFELRIVIWDVHCRMDDFEWGTQKNMHSHFRESVWLTGSVHVLVTVERSSTGVIAQDPDDEVHDCAPSGGCEKESIRLDNIRLSWREWR